MRKTKISSTKLGKVGVVVAAAGVVLTLSPAVTQAQSLRPNILIVFDTSGSMLNGGNDGSPLCGNNGQTSRIYSLKKALRDALAQVGTDEANFGLMRYPQTTGTAAPVCPRGHYDTGTGGGCRLSLDTTANNTTAGEMAYGAWFDTAVGQSLIVPVTRPSTGAKPLAGSDFDPSDANITEVYKWIDLSESAAGTPITDPELRSPSNASTPIGRSLFYARLYFDNYVKATQTTDAGVVPLDPKGSCRQNLVIFVTDGSEQCDTARPALTTVVNPATCAAAASFATYNPEVQACKLKVMSKVPVYILTDSSIAAADQATANRIATLGGTGPTAIYVTLTDTNAVKQALVDIIAKTVPPAEICNGVDDNCNGQIDEGVKNACALDPNPAHYPMTPVGPPNLLTHCAVESRNCLDDNCNGQIDEGFPLNACGQPGGCPVPPETCDGLDNDCDGDIDEGFNVGTACDNGLQGACHRTGITACNTAGTGTVCDAPVVTPTQELCNNIDDNCNGSVDEGTLPGVGVACGTSLGNCRAGITQCVNGRIVCSTSSMPTVETCNGIDDNCDGVVDNGAFPETGTTCLCAGLAANQVGVGTCKAGHLICRGTRGFVCEGCVLPGAEICDGLDNDCDGMADVNPICPSGLGCKEGRCTLQCVPGEFPCPNGYKCVSDYCVPQRCAGKTCPTDMRCDETTGSCVDVCLGVVCRDPKICQHGNCVDCYNFGCATGQMCNAGRCQVDKCLGVTCPGNQYCDDGKCIDLCTKNKCAGTELCVAGACVTDKCANVGCGSGQFCDPTTGNCRVDICAVTQCGKGERCIKTDGTCAADPCNLVSCPGPCWQCVASADGIATCRVSGDCKEISTQVGIKGGGDGCGCAVGASGDGGSGLGLLATALGLAGMLSMRRRRR